MDNIVAVELGITGDVINTDELTEIMGVEPTSIRTKEDWPKAIKDNTSLPEELKPRMEWGFDEKIGSCYQVEQSLLQFLDMFKGREKNIVEYCNRNKLNKTIIVVIHANEMELPEMSLSSYLISRLNKLEVELDFDIYVNESWETEK